MKIMKLNIYENKKIVKTYEADTYDLMMGTVEDFAKLVDLDKLQNGTDVEIIKIVGDIVSSGFDEIKTLLKDVFEGITDEELRNTKIKDIMVVVIEIIKYSIIQISKGASGKN